MRVANRILAATAAVVLSGAGALPAVAAPQYPGDLEASFVGWFDAQGHRIDAAKPGDSVTAHYTITNTLSYPVRINGVDSQLTRGDCVRDFVRASRNTDPGGQLPVYLMPGDTTPELVDVAFTLSAQSTCASSAPVWYANVIGEQTTSPFPTPSVSRATVEVTQTSTVTEHQQREARPLYIAGAVALVAVVAAVAAYAFGRRRR